MKSTKAAIVLEQTTVITKLRENKAYRIKFIRTLCILLSYITLVCFICQVRMNKVLSFLHNKFFILYDSLMRDNKNERGRLRITFNPNMRTSLQDETIMNHSLLINNVNLLESIQHNQFVIEWSTWVRAQFVSLHC